MSATEILTLLFRPKSVRLRRHGVERILRKYKVPDWFSWVLNDRGKLPHVWKSCFWIHDHLPRDARLLETACGCGWNLIWLGQQGFDHLYGFDLDPQLIAAGRELADLARLTIRLWEDDGLAPKHLPRERFDLIFGLNWTYLVEQCDIRDFVQFYSQHLWADGVLLFDVIDLAYNDAPNNQFHTSDWKKPKRQRRPSEYTRRYSRDEIEQAAAAADMNIIEIIAEKQAIPKRVYVLKKA